MAKPIKETPVLKGQDAVIFIKNIEENKTAKISHAESTRIKLNFDKINAIFQR